MNHLLQQPIFQITLPLMVTFVAAIGIASWSQNKRFDDTNRRLDEIIKRLDRIEAKLFHAGDARFAIVPPSFG